MTTTRRAARTTGALVLAVALLTGCAEGGDDSAGEGSG